MERYRFSQQEQAFLEGLPEAVAVFQLVDKKIVTLALSDGFCELLGTVDRTRAYHEMDQDTYINVYPDDRARVVDAVVRFMRDGGRFETIYRLKYKTGDDYRVIHAIGKHVFKENGVRLAHVWYTDEGLYSGESSGEGMRLNQTLSNALYEESLIMASRYDHLTGLSSLPYFFETSDALRGRVESSGGQSVILYMDLNGMKLFNKRHGLEEGDKLLKAFASVLCRHFDKEMCSRLSGDHFAVITAEEGVIEKLRLLFNDCAGMNEGKNIPVHVGIYPDRLGRVHISAACDRAKLACGSLNNIYGSSWNYYNLKLNENLEKRQYIIGSFDKACKEKWIQVHYQPIVRAVTEKVCDVEALARWIDPVKGVMSPADFIPTLEEAGLIYKLDLYVLEQVLEKMRNQAKAGIYVMPHSINLSRSDFDACDIVEEIRKRVDASGMARDRITIEITESVIGRDFEFMKEQIRRFQDLGFPVWMDDFGSGYSSLDVLQSIRFNLIKFDMSFMRRLDEGEGGKIILTELMKMATALGLDTVCEGVETQEQVRFLQEIGCSKLQGFYFSRPIPLEKIREYHAQGSFIGFENPEESDYYETIGRVNLYDLSVISSGDTKSFRNAFSTLPMGVIEVRGDSTRFVRSNQSYRDFIRRIFGFDLVRERRTFEKYSTPFMMNLVRTCCETGDRSFYDEKMPDGSVVHSFARRIGTDPITGTVAIAIAILSVKAPGEGTTYADIARALASDYYNIYVVNLDTEHFIEYTSPAGRDELAMERHGEDFFAAARQDIMVRIYEDDRNALLEWFSKETIVRELDRQGVITAAYRLIDSGAPVHVVMKITRLQPNRIILGVSLTDSHIQQ